MRKSPTTYINSTAESKLSICQYHSCLVCKRQSAVYHAYTGVHSWFQLPYVLVHMSQACQLGCADLCSGHSAADLDRGKGWKKV